MKKKAKNFIDMTGVKYGDLTVLYLDEERTAKTKYKTTYWICQCKCVNIKSVEGTSLRNGEARKNCGCESIKHKNPRPIKEYTQEELQLKRCKTIHYGMMSRCYNEQHNMYHMYGGKGILVTPEWHDRDKFIEDMFEAYLEYEVEHGINSATIDRINNSKGYNKENCRWLNMEGQLENRVHAIIYEVEVRGVVYPSVGQLQAAYPEIAMHTMLARYRAGKRGEDLIAPVKRANANKGKKLNK